jgi:hypothetical protein
MTTPRFMIHLRQGPKPPASGSNVVTIEDGKGGATIDIEDPSELERLITELQQSLPFLEQTQILRPPKK